MVDKHKPSKKKRNNASAVSRLFSIGKLGLDLARTEAGYHVKRAMDRSPELQKLGTQMTQIHMITKTLGEMKGAVMKIGQMLSLYDAPGIPPEVREILSQLQKQAPALPFDEMTEIIHADFPKFFDELSFESPKPIAAASIGQVYKARYKDRDVVIKVQIPDIEKIIRSDLKNLNVLTKLFSPWISQREIKALVQEIREHLIAECDYTLEAKNLDRFHSLFSDHPSIIFPSVIPELSSKHVLTMTYVEGDDVQAFLKTNPSKAKRNEIMQTLFEFYINQIFVHNLVHADPQFGNYIFQPEKTGVIDFGCVKYFKNNFTHNLLVFIQACFEHDKPAIHKGYLALGLTTPRNPPKLYEYLDEFIDIAEVTYKRDRYQYGEYAVVHKIFQALPKMLMHRNLHYPPDLLMLERTVAGLYFLAEKLQANVPLKSLIEKLILSSDKIKEGYR